MGELWPALSGCSAHATRRAHGRGVHGAGAGPTSGHAHPIIQRIILPGSTIHSDQWAAYRQLHADPSYTYATVNHSQNFVDPVTGAHTQAIESYWAKVKSKFKSMKGVSTAQLPGYLDERMWRGRHGRDVGDAFANI